MRKWLLFGLFISGCHRSEMGEQFCFIQIHDRNNLTETINNPDRLANYEKVDFLTSQPYKKVLRVYKSEGKNLSKITTYHPNGMVWQYLEAEEMRAHGQFKEWFPNGQLKIEASVVGGTGDLSASAQEDWVFDGMSQVFDEQGHRVAQIPYEKGFLEGRSLYYYPSGQMEREVPFHKNEIEGEVVEHHLDGSLRSKTTYQKGLKSGESLAFFSEGKVAAVEEFSEGALQSGTYFDPQGVKVAEVVSGEGFQAVFENGALTLVEYRQGKPEGILRKFTLKRELQRSYLLKGGKKNGEEIEYFLSQDLEVSPSSPLAKLSVTWKDNAIHGPVKTWYNNGQLQSQREFAKNQKSGPSLAWYRDGGLMLMEEYEEDRLVSGKYFKRQKQELVSSITHGNGLATLYDENGAFLRKVTYAKGKPIDPEN